MNILFIGDVFGAPGREYVEKNLAAVKHREKIDFCIANCENASHGRGLSEKNARELTWAGIDVVTMGNHVWGNSEITDYIDDFPMVRPGNIGKNLPGKGYKIFHTEFGKIGVLNIEGRYGMDLVGDNPFEYGLSACEELKKQGADIIFVDFHAEATSEKKLMGLILDGKATAVVGTHTHVQTADECILPKGTAFITDVGMTGVSYSSVIGMDFKGVNEKIVRGLPSRFIPAEGKANFNAIVLETDNNTFRAKSIRRIFE